MMLTRCPACQTVFRLHPEQLRARNGEVRCGHCFNPFNALQHRIATADQPADAMPGPAGEARPPSPRSREPTPAAAASAADTLDFELPEFPPFDDARPAAGPPALEHRPGTTLPGAASSAAEAPAPDQADLEEPTTAADALPEVIRSARRSPAEFDERPPRTTSSTSTSGWTEDISRSAPPPAYEPAYEPTSDTAEGAEASEGATSAEAPSGSAPAAPPEARHVDLDHLDATYGRPRSKRSAMARTLSGLAAGLLAGTLAAQSTYLFRTELSRALPGVRPLLEAGCAVLGCTVPLPRDVALIAIETSDLQSDPVRSGRYVLFTTVKNRADYPQAWPHLELTLTDATDTPVIRRVLAPEDWVAPGELKDSMAARATIPVRVPFALEGASPTGYRVYVFFP